MQLGFAVGSFIFNAILPRTATSAIILCIKLVFPEFLKEICFVPLEINSNFLMNFDYFVMLNIRNWMEKEIS